MQHRWSYDGNYFARFTEEQITVFESAVCEVLPWTIPPI
jgi:hypothetical protein